MSLFIVAKCCSLFPGTEGAVLFDQRALPPSLFGLPSVAVDVNAEYSPPSYQKDEYLNVLFSSHKGPRALSLTPHLVTSATKLVQRPHLLLHVAIDNNHLEMVEYLLVKGADVSGELQVAERGTFS